MKSKVSMQNQMSLTINVQKLANNLKSVRLYQTISNQWCKKADLIYYVSFMIAMAIKKGYWLKIRRHIIECVDRRAYSVCVCVCEGTKREG